MAALRFIDLRSHPMEFLDFTSLTPGEFPQLVLRLPYKFLPRGLHLHASWCPWGA